MEGKNRNDLVFELYYSYNLENLNYHLNDRLNKLLITIQLLLSSAVFGDLDRFFPDFHLNIIIGFILAILSVLSLVYGFGEKAALSKVAQAQYQPLLKSYSTMTDEELNHLLITSDLLNNNITGALTDIAYKRASIQLELEDDTELSFCQLFVAKFCGEKF
nr:MAG TPA: SMODS and SLOG-associating 2TM effector domain family 5 [Caudoviricetes sp.]